jgi:hypothetical protein
MMAGCTSLLGISLLGTPLSLDVLEATWQIEPTFSHRERFHARCPPTAFISDVCILGSRRSEYHERGTASRSDNPSLKGIFSQLASALFASFSYQVSECQICMQFLFIY